MSGNPFELPFPEILLPTGIRSDGVVNLETDRDPFSLQLRTIFAATIRPIFQSRNVLTTYAIAL